MRRFFRSFLRAYLPTPHVPTSPILAQTLQPVVTVDEVTELGPKIVPRTQWGFALVLAGGAGTHSGLRLVPGSDGLYLDAFELGATTTMRIFMVVGGGTPVGWTDAASFGSFHQYNPADPADPPQQSGPLANTYMAPGFIAAANLPGDSLSIIMSPGETFPRHANRIYIPPNFNMVLVNAAANAILVANAMVMDPTFRTNARL